MRYTNERIDHLVYAVPDLDQAIKDIEKKFGIAPIKGGTHKSQGTHNALVHLGSRRYLEILAIDKSNKQVKPPHWMGLDLIGRPRLTRWAVSTNDLDKDVDFLTEIDPRLGEIKGGQRRRPDGTKLFWKFSLPLPAPEVEVLPFIINWQGSDHPTNTLPEGCNLIALKATHPTPFLIEPAIHALDVDIEIDTAVEVSLTAIIDTPNGVVEI
ncbi:MAG: VOC family protein [Lewinellaceae bacterium]|nr:VOC family protein [Saprospiraceae bacterium]MCB9340619.1 VOC family protein [Lewinellaceae bacterium]